jgi:hypothetical protein
VGAVISLDAKILAVAVVVGQNRNLKAAIMAVVGVAGLAVVLAGIANVYSTPVI